MGQVLREDAQRRPPQQGRFRPAFASASSQSRRRARRPGRGHGTWVLGASWGRDGTTSKAVRGARFRSSVRHRRRTDWSLCVAPLPPSCTSLHTSSFLVSSCLTHTLGGALCSTIARTGCQKEYTCTPDDNVDRLTNRCRPHSLLLGASFCLQLFLLLRVLFPDTQVQLHDLGIRQPGFIIVIKTNESSHTSASPALYHRAGMLLITWGVACLA